MNAARPESPRARFARARIVASLLLLACVSACGFHLQGHTPLPESIRAPYVESADDQSEFVQSLRRALLISGAHPVDRLDQASAVIHILRDDVVRRTLSVSAANQPNEYELTYTVRFAVSSTAKELLAPQDVSTVQSFSFNEAELLAKGHEENILRRGMARDLADIVMRRLSSL